MKRVVIIEKITLFLTEIFLFCIVFLMLFLSIFTLYFSLKKEKVLSYLEAKTENYIKQKIDGEFKISSLNLNVKGPNLFLSARSILFLRDKNEIKIENLLIKINFVKALLSSFEPYVIADIVDVKYVKSNENKALESPNNVSNIFYLKLLDIFVKKLNFSSEIMLDFEDLSIKLEPKNFDDLSLEIRLNTILKQQESDGYINANCQKNIIDLSCQMESINLTESTLKKGLSRVKPYYLTYKNGKLKSLFLDFVYKDKLEILNLNLNIENADIEMPFLKMKKRINISNLDGSLIYNNNIWQGFFKLKSEEKFAIGTFSKSQNFFNLDVEAQGIKAIDIKHYWPKNYFKNLANWLEESVLEGDFKKTFVHISHPMKSSEDLIVEVDAENATLHYSNYLPKVEKINAKVVVKNQPEVEIFLQSATSKNLDILKNSFAIFNTEKDELILDLKAKGKFSDVINFFIPTAELSSIFAKNFDGKATINAKIEIPIVDEKQIFKFTKIESQIALESFKNPLFKGKKILLKATKERRKNTQIHFFLPNNVEFFNSCKGEIENFKFDFLLNLENGDFGFENVHLKGENVDFRGAILLNYENENPLKNANFDVKKMCQSENIKIALNSNKKKISGDVLELESIKNFGLFEFIKSFNTKKADFDDILKQEVEIDFAKLYLTNGINAENLSFKSLGNGDFTLNSSIASGYKNGSGIEIKVPNLGLLMKGILGFSELQDGNLTITAKKKKENLQGKILLENYNLKLNKFDFSSKSAKGEFKVEKDIIKIEYFTIKNLKNTFVINGNINKNTLNLDLEAFYTPSSADINTLLDFVPGGYASEAFNYITFGTLRKGVITFAYTVKGELGKQIVQFEGIKTGKSFLFKAGVVIGIIGTGFNPLLLPVLGVLAIF